MKPVFITCKGFQTAEHLSIIRVDQILSVEFDPVEGATRIEFVGERIAYVLVEDKPAQVRRLIDEALKEPSA